MRILRNLFLTLLCFVPMVVSAQGEVKWSHSVADKGNGSYTVQFKAQIANGWHIYVNDPAKAFNPTEITFESGEGVTAEGFEGEGTSADRNLSFGSAENNNLVTGTVTEITYPNTTIGYGGSTNVAGNTATIEEADGNKYVKIVCPPRAHDKDRSFGVTSKIVNADGAAYYVYQVDMLIDVASNKSSTPSIIIYKIFFIT